MKKTLRTALIVLLSAVFVFCVAHIVWIQIDYQKADDLYRQSREDFHVAESPASSLPAAASGSSSAAGVSPEAGASSEAEDFFPDAYVDMKDLLHVNPEIVGWIWIPDTAISYPLVRADNNQKYLTLSYNLKRTNSGSIFMDYRNPADFSGDNTIIYGHNMKNGSMFGKLKKFADVSYLKAHSYVYFFTVDRILKYRIFAGYQTQSTSESYTPDFTGDISYDKFISYLKTSAGGDLTELPEARAPLLTLSTCTSVRHTDRFVIHAVFVAEKAEQAVSSSLSP